MDVPTLLEIASQHQQAGRLGEAEAALRDALALQPSAAGWNDLGAVLAQTGRMDEAQASFARAVELDPAFAPAHANLANALLAVGRRVQAIDALRTATARLPDDYELHATLGELLLQDDPGGAEAAFA